MLAGKVKGHFVIGENPAVGSANGKAAAPRRLPKLDWLVVRDLVEIESATFWHDSPEIETGELRTEEIATEVFFLPAAAHTEKDGTLHEHPAPAAVAPQGDRADGRPPLRALVLLPPRPQDPRAARGLDGSEGPPDPRPDVGLPDGGQIEEPSAEAVLREINGCDDEGQRSPAYKQLKDDGSTACGCWIYCGVYADERNQAARRKPHGSRTARRSSGAGRGRRTGGSSTTAPRPTRPASRGPSASATSGGTRSRASGRAHDAPDFDADKRPDYEPPDGAEGRDAIARRRIRSSCRPTAAAGSTRRRGSSTGRCRPTTSRTSRRFATRSTAGRRIRPVSSYRPGPRTRTTRPASRTDVFPYVSPRTG